MRNDKLVVGTQRRHVVAHAVAGDGILTKLVIAQSWRSRMRSIGVSRLMKGRKSLGANGTP
jgi:hypothetical protein